MSLFEDALLTRRTYPDGREVIDVGRQDRCFLVIRRLPHALMLKAHFASAFESSSQDPGISVCIRPGSASLIDVTGMTLNRWHMAGGLLPPRSKDIFSTLMADIYNKALRQVSDLDAAPLNLPLEYPSTGHSPDPHLLTFSNSASCSMQIAREALRGAAIHSVKLCDRKLLRVVRPFSPSMRPWLYTQVAADRSGRLAQLASSCPGALVFAYALWVRKSSQPVATDLMKGAIGGRCLRRLLREAVSNWSAASAEQGIVEEVATIQPWLRLRAAGIQERRRLEADQRLLVRRAGPRSDPAFVLTPPPLAFAPEDIPKSALENARWFRTMKTSPQLSCPDAAQHETLLRRLSHFASKHFRVLHPPRQAHQIHRRMSQLIHYVLASGRHTSRSTPPTRLLSECSEWHRTVHDSLSVCDPVDGAPVSLRTEFGYASAGPWADSRVVVTPIRAVGDLIELGETMRNCVASRAHAALQGRCSYYSVEVDGAPITVELTHEQNGRVFLSEIAGFANREVCGRELAAIEPWLSEVSNP